MSQMYQCRSCGEVFDDDQAEFIPKGHEIHYVGDGSYIVPVGDPACPACFSTSFDDYEPHNDEE